jgi:siroheme synthase
VRQFAVVTGASADEDLDLDWAALAKGGQAFAIYMGVRTAADLAARLVAAGADPATAVVIVENGTLPEERAVATELQWLEGAIAHKNIEGPAIIFVGLDWADAGLQRPEGVEVYVPQRAGNATRAAAREPALPQAG